MTLFNDKRIDEILRRQELYTNQWPWPRRIPHKCPVCDGHGARGVPVLGSSNRTAVPCHACDGTGIVWSDR